MSGVGNLNLQVRRGVVLTAVQQRGVSSWTLLSFAAAAFMLRAVMLMLGPPLVALADDFGTSIAGADRAGRIALDKLQTLASHAGTTRGDSVESTVTTAIAETEDVKGLGGCRSVVWMGSGVYMVCHVIISTDQGLRMGCPAPKHHSRVPVARQSREDVTGRRGPYIRQTKRHPARRPKFIPADSYDGYVPASLLALGAPSVVLPIVGGAAIARGL